jgi:hypothetical protein
LKGFNLICPTGKSATAADFPKSSLDRKNISVFPKPDPLYIHRRLVPLEGRIAIVTDAGRDAVDAGGANDEGAKRGRRRRVVLTPRRRRQVCA